MKRITLFLIITALFTSCDPDIKYLNGTKLVVEGKIVDKNNFGIPNTEIIVAFEKFSGYGYDYREPGLGYTDANGNFKLYVTSASNEDQMIIIFNEEKAHGYQQKKLLNIKDADFSDYKFNIGTTMLYPIDDLVSLKVIFQRSSGSNDIILENVSFTGASSFYENYINPIENYSYSEIFRYDGIFKNQNVNIQYDLRNTFTNTSTTETRNISIEDLYKEEIIIY
jgi:hypothetical protein